MKKRAIAAVVLIVCAASAPAEGAQQGSYGGKLYGINDKSLSHPVKGSAVSFSVTNGRVRSFKARGGVSTCIIASFLPPFIPTVHVYPLTFSVPSAQVKRRNAVDAKYRKGRVTNTLKGTFTGRAAGKNRSGRPELVRRPLSLEGRPEVARQAARDGRTAISARVPPRSVAQSEMK